MIELVFWLSVSLVLYAYIGYPLILKGVSLCKDDRRPFKSEDVPQSVTLVISMANESLDRIRDKIKNTMKFKFQYEYLRVIIALDNPSATTLNYVESNVPSKWKIISSDKPVGKESMQAMAFRAYSKSDVYIFTDATSTLTDDSIPHLVWKFTDPSVGAVDGESKIVSQDGVVSSEGVYLRYENAIRDLESKVNSLVTCGGCLFAARREVVERLFDRPIQSDFGAALTSVDYGYRAVLCHEAIVLVPDLKDTTKEFARKRRTVLRGMNSLWNYRELLNPFTHPLFAFQLWSHKVAKWAVPVALLGAALSNQFLLTESWFYFVTLDCQAILYFLAWIGIQNPASPASYLKIPAFFVMSNLAIASALVGFARGEEARVWKESER